MIMLFGLQASYGKRDVYIVKVIRMVAWLTVLIVLMENTLMPLLKSVLKSLIKVISLSEFLPTMKYNLYLVL